MVITLTALSSQASVTIPSQLDQSDRVQALEILGYGTSGKLLSNPYPLGGYFGVEMALSFESLDVRELSTLGALAKPQENLVYPTLSFGKGVYGNIDIFFHFIPFIERISLSKFGGLMRWSFFQSESWPLSLSAILQAGSSNIDNKVITTTFGYALVGSVQLWKLSLFGGVGKTHAKGQFMGDNSIPNESGVTDSGLTERERVEDAQSFGGVSYLIPPIFITFEVDRIRETVYGLRMGFRF